ncbi:GNAT family N-acetyltransferase [Secundilactobacillus folii]|uniref:GNAT family N-acetyltransferase n=1 Tax=Secundilactobacillus folii TaxID=2678357 RepID=A0A7X2XVV1_9LACO|nr:GNAT family protein [Secundilactobacillus folii]MTV82643.1 GNAT family N-acetyltransferase [Secundilactobacillus folii]
MRPKQPVKITPVTLTDAPEIYRLVSTNMTSLSPWLPWAKRMSDIATERHFLKYAIQKQAQGQLFMFTIRVNGEVAGAIDLHNIDSDDRHAEIGYWLGDQFRGQGVMAESLKQIELIAKGLQIHVLLILADVGNNQSQRVAIRSGYLRSGLISEYLYDGKEWHDCVFYSKVLSPTVSD